MEIPEAIITTINAMLMPYGRSFGPPKEVPVAVVQAVNAMLSPYGEQLNFDTDKPAQEKKNYTLQEAAAEMGLPYMTIYKMCRGGMLKTWKTSDGKHAKYFIPAAEIKAKVAAMK